MRATPIALGLSCTTLALLLSLHGEEPAPPRIVRERHQYHQPVSPAVLAAAALPSSPDIPTSHRAKAPLPAACVPGRLCDTPQLRHAAGDGEPTGDSVRESTGVREPQLRSPVATPAHVSQLLSPPPPPPPPALGSAGRHRATPVFAPHAPEYEPRTRTPSLPTGPAMLRVRQAPGEAPLADAVVVSGVGKKEARDFECPTIRQGPFCFACQVACGGRGCAEVVRACARLPHCTFAKVNTGRTFGTLKTSDASFLEGVAAAAATKKERQVGTCALAGARPQVESARKVLGKCHRLGGVACAAPQLATLAAGTWHLAGRRTRGQPVRRSRPHARLWRGRGPLP